MEAPPNYQNNHSPQTHSLLPSPNSHSSTSSSNSTTTSSNAPPLQPPPLPSPKPITRSESANPYPTTFVQADTSSFKQVVQMLTGSPRPTSTAATQPDPLQKTHTHNIPPIKTMPKKNQSSSGFKLYERRNSLKNLKINPLNPIFSSGFSPRKPEILSPSILDFPALVLSPVTPLIPDPFDRSGAVKYYNNPARNNNNLMDIDAEEKAIKDKGFFLHPSPASTPREAEPRLLPLFPVTSPRVSSGSANPSS
ncbi:VQ motif-containing protein 4 [Mercurialis annua]|uniref:VQ motif-containing protein 4 n=1 Tax=Mercurialis annua TaxID=3986 RepID=UPI002160E5CB|nr:VQ motif-containing protein 4 [Mercurialis annua]